MESPRHPKPAARIVPVHQIGRLYRTEEDRLLALYDVPEPDFLEALESIEKSGRVPWRDLKKRFGSARATNILSLLDVLGLGKKPGEAWKLDPAAISACVSLLRGRDGLGQ